MKKLIFIGLILCFFASMGWATEEVAHYYMNDQLPVTAAQFKLNDALADTVVIDENGTNGTLDNGTTAGDSITGKINLALDFDGTDDYVDTNQQFDATDTDVFTGSWTIAFWAKPDDGQPAATEYFCGSKLGVSGSARSVSVRLQTTGYVSASISFGSPATALATGFVFDDGTTEWTHISAVYDTVTNKMSLYANGVLLQTGSAVGGAFVTTLDFVIGAYNRGNGTSSEFAGGMDDFRIYASAFDANQVVNLYNRGNGTEGSSTNVIDSSSTATDGTLAGGETTAGVSVAGKINEALHLDGAADYINADSLVTTTATDTAGTISMWIFQDDDSGAIEQIFSSGETAAINTFFEFRANETAGKDYWRCRIFVDSATKWDFHTAVDSTDAFIGVWYHLVLVQNGTQPNLYINGVLRTDLTRTVTTDETVWFNAIFTAATDKANNANIGSINFNGTGAAQFWDGSIDDTRIYPKALTAGEISAIYEGGRGTEGALNHAGVGIGILCGSNAGSN